MTAALERLLEIEVNATEERRLAGRLRFACLPDPWTLADFDFDAEPGVDEKLILATLRFLTTYPTCSSSGRPGSARRCSPPRSRAARPRPATGSTSPLRPTSPPAATRPRSKDARDGASALFQVINPRYLKSSTILTTNVGIADWATAFGDATSAAAMLDGLLHRARTSSASTAHPIDSARISPHRTGCGKM